MKIIEREMNEKEIEEMANDIFNTCAWRFGNPNDYKELCKDIAEYLIKSGYRKIPEGSVVLSKEEYETLVKTAHDKIGDMQLNEFIKACLLSGWAVQSVNTEEQVRKETAKEILKAVLEDVGEFYAGDIVEELAKKYGVKVEE